MNALHEDNNGLLYSMDRSVDIQSVMRQVYIWMGMGLLLTALVAFLSVATPLVYIATNPVMLIIAMALEFGLVLGISLGLNRMSSLMATFLFFVYAAVNGFTFAVILLSFSIQSVFLAFAATAGLFVVMSVIGYTTKIDLTKMGTFFLMALIGLVIAMVVNMFVNSGPLDMLISAIGVLVFTGLTAYDTQRIGRMAGQMRLTDETAAKFGIFGALKLYLDFINMFLFILRLLGGRRR